MSCALVSMLDSPAIKKHWSDTARNNKQGDEVLGTTYINIDDCSRAGQSGYNSIQHINK